MNWMRTDGLLHMETSFILVVFFYCFTGLFVPKAEALVAGVFYTFAVGVLKEIYDRITGKGAAEWHDLECDAIGIVLSLCCLCCL